MPFGSAYPEETWPVILRFLEAGGKPRQRRRAPVRGGGVAKGLGLAGATRIVGLLQGARLHAHLPGPRRFGRDLGRRRCRACRPGVARNRLPRRRRVRSRHQADQHEGLPRRGRLGRAARGPRAAARRRARTPPARLSRRRSCGSIGWPAGSPAAPGCWRTCAGASARPRSERSSMPRRRAPIEITARPTLAGYVAGEVPEMEVTVRRPGASSGRAPPRRGDAGLHRPGWAEPRHEGSDGHRHRSLLHRPGRLLRPRPPARPRSARGARDRGHPAARRGDDRPATSRPAPVSGSTTRRCSREARRWCASKDGFTRNGRPFPVLGTTYMASDVHRRFLLEPNPSLWNRDFARDEGGRRQPGANGHLDGLEGLHARGRTAGRIGAAGRSMSSS